MAIPGAGERNPDRPRDRRDSPVGNIRSGGVPSGGPPGPEDDDRPRTEGGGIEGPEGGGGEPTKNLPGLVQQAEDALTRLDKNIRGALGADPFEESFRPDPRTPNDEREPFGFGQILPVPTEEEEIVPGNPDDLGERGRRRRTRDDVNASPVLRRGLLGV